MQYNLLTSAMCQANLMEGNKSFTHSDLRNLSDYTAVPVATLSGSDISVIEFDLGQRIHIDRFEYKFIDPISAPTHVASGIKFHYKDESFEEYIILPTLVDSSDIFYTTVPTPQILAPRYLKCSHTLSGTYGVPTGSGILYGFKAFNNDTIVDFGSSANKEQELIEVARGAVADIRPVPIYNSGSSVANALINVEPKFSNADEILSISDNIDGPWIKPLDEGDLKVSASNISTGTMVDTAIVDGVVSMAGATTYNSKYITKTDHGQYTTPVIKKENHSSFSRIIINKDGSAPGRIAVDDDDSVETVEFRSSNVKPKTYAVIRTLSSYTMANSAKVIIYKEYDLSTKVNVPGNFTLFDFNSGSYTYWQNYGIVIDKITERCACWASCISTNTTYNASKLYVINSIGSSYKYKELSQQTEPASPVNFNFRHVKIDYSGGSWMYFFCQSYSASHFVDASGYYLVYFDSSLNTKFKWFLSTDEIGKVDVNYNTRELWYTRPSSSAIYKIGIDGTVTAEFSSNDYTNTLGGIAVLPDGSVIFGNGKYIHYLKYNGAFIEDASILCAVDTSVDYIVLDGDGSEAVWVIDGLNVGRLFVSGEYKGQYDFKVDNIGFPSSMESVSGGVWVKCAESEVTSVVAMKFISKENRRADFTYIPAFSSTPALIYNEYDNINYNKRVPIYSDTVWPYLPWSKISTNTYLLPEDDYYQLRITLRRPSLFEAWPTLTTNPNQEFISSDYFEQIDTTPNQLIWGDWSSKPSLSRVYVPLGSSALRIIPTQDSGVFINTANRVAYGVDSSNTLEIIMAYKIASGNLTPSGETEHLYLYLRSVDAGFSGYSMNCHVYAHEYINTNNTLIYCECNALGSNSSTNAPLGQGPYYYEGEIRVYLDFNNNTISSGWRSGGSSSWTAISSLPVSPAQIGRHFELQISADKNCSPMQINHVYMKSGQAYYYTESPRLLGVNEQKALEISNIGPNQYKNMYIKTFVPRDLDISSGNDVDVKVRWRVNSY